MCEVVEGSKIRKHEEGNTYLVVGESAGCYQLECVGFVAAEDLGDQIICSRLRQKTWVAGYFVRHFKVQQGRHDDQLSLGRRGACT